MDVFLVGLQNCGVVVDAANNSDSRSLKASAHTASAAKDVNPNNGIVAPVQAPQDDRPQMSSSPINSAIDAAAAPSSATPISIDSPSAEAVRFADPT